MNKRFVLIENVSKLAKFWDYEKPNNYFSFCQNIAYRAFLLFVL